MSAIVFTNQGEIDIRSISTFGVSVKEGKNPIGFFGTGLKYAIAVLLRNNHKITICSGLNEFTFHKVTESVRGQSFDFVAMSVNGAATQSIGFTTELGKTWEMWMAYREIACNCIDEAGSVDVKWITPSPEAGMTKIVVHGAAFADEHSKRREILLDDEPAMTIDGVEIRCRRGRSLFYRGVRVGQLEHPGLYTYNLTESLDLTEDRTVKAQYMPPYHISCAWLTECKDRDMLRRVLTASGETFEGQLRYSSSHGEPSADFTAVVMELSRTNLTEVNASALALVRERNKHAVAPTEFEMTRVQRMALDRAIDFCSGIGFHIRDYPIKLVGELGGGCLGLALDGTIFITERVFHQGTKQLASTLIEEYLHLRHKYKDCTRELQTYLFDKVVSLGEELRGEPL